MWFKSALTLSYVGNHLFDGISGKDWNAVPAGAYTTSQLQAALPYPGFPVNGITLYQNLGETWYNALHLKWERRFADGLAFMASYAFGRMMSDNLASNAYANVQPLTPPGYLTGRSPNDRTHILAINALYELPVGKGRRFLAP